MKDKQKTLDIKFMNFTMKHNFRNSIDSKKSDSEVIIATPEEQKRYEGASMGEHRRYEAEKLSTIVESPNNDREAVPKCKASEESKSVRMSTTETPSEKQKKKVILRKSIIKEMEKKLQNIGKVTEEYPKLEIKTKDITIDSKIEGNNETNDNSHVMMKITENTINVSCYKLIYLAE